MSCACDVARGAAASDGVRRRGIGYWHAGVYVGDGTMIHLTTNGLEEKRIDGPMDESTVVEEVPVNPEWGPNDDETIKRIAR